MVVSASCQASSQRPLAADQPSLISYVSPCLGIPPAALDVPGVAVSPPCHALAEQADRGGHRRTRSGTSSGTGGTLRTPQDTHGITPVRDREASGGTTRSGA